MSELRVKGVSLYYEEHGEGTPILCIHGTGSSAKVWGDAVQELASHGRTIVYDRRGCTRSERPDPYELTSVEEHADDAAALLQELHATPAIVIGRSYGGEIAVNLVERYPGLVKALVLLEPAILTLTAEAHAWEAALVDNVFLAAKAGGPEAGADCFYREVLGDKDWSRLPDDLRSMVLDNAPAILAELKGGSSRPDEGIITQLRKPVLVVSGATSPAPFRAVDEVLADLIPGSVHEIVEGGHLIDPAGPKVLAFLDEQLRAKAASPASAEGAGAPETE
ncbi:alpha/beta hydrolase fold protein [Arthrobacter crystallopoietes BAB-32]|uniref:Alpha/beta hydrolase fold protein n=1 Tax=Arthrobacter crystallopoietes BAB-32 TaxID=1246476 RepID=N1V1T4_9MICC|nr:alpha/beta hydrolase [Arthrobacter crystallopoietes]EMY34042.1 alpha/beta hydrolase fold protein [Arthrobacter crystallopoietes BAB-32]